MDELRRMAYLDALGIDNYVSRRQLPGAAVTRRLAVVPRPQASGAVTNPPHHSSTTTGAAQAVKSPIMARPTPGRRDPPERPSASPTSANADAASAPRFTLVTLVAGDWLWLEALLDLPLATEQLQLIQSMAHALLTQRASRAALPSMAPAPPGVDRPDGVQPDAPAPGRTRGDIIQFDWPLHANRQLDQGESAARAAVAGFLARRIEQHRCRGLVLLGQAGAARVPTGDLGVASIVTASTAEMLADPSLKRQVWLDLLPLADAQ